MHDPRNHNPNLHFPTRRALDRNRLDVGQSARDDFVKPRAGLTRDVHRKAVRRKPVAHLHADAGHLLVRAEKHTRVFRHRRRRHRCESVRLAQVQRQRALQPADIVPNADRGARTAEVEQRIAYELAWAMVRELSASLGEHKIRAEGVQSRAFRCGFGLGLTASAGVDWFVLEEEKDVLVLRCGRSSALV
jgi:hypothetical protein